jgi:hypothetical protein
VYVIRKRIYAIQAKNRDVWAGGASLNTAANSPTV